MAPRVKAISFAGTEGAPSRGVGHVAARGWGDEEGNGWTGGVLPDVGTGAAGEVGDVPRCRNGVAVRGWLSVVSM